MAVAQRADLDNRPDRGRRTGVYGSLREPGVIRLLVRPSSQGWAAAEGLPRPIGRPHRGTAAGGGRAPVGCLGRALLRRPRGRCGGSRPAVAPISSGKSRRTRRHREESARSSGGAITSTLVPRRPTQRLARGRRKRRPGRIDTGPGARSPRPRHRCGGRRHRATADAGRARRLRKGRRGRRGGGRSRDPGLPGSARARHDPDAPPPSRRRSRGECRRWPSRTRTPTRRRCWAPERAGCSGLGPASPMPASSSPTTTPQQSRESAVASMASRRHWNSPRPGSARSLSRRWRPAWTTTSRHWTPWVASEAG